MPAVSVGDFQHARAVAEWNPKLAEVLEETVTFLANYANRLVGSGAMVIAILGLTASGALISPKVLRGYVVLSYVIIKERIHAR